MDYDEFFARMEKKEVSINLTGDIKAYRLSNEALFHIPLISMVILLFAKDRRKPYVAELGQLVGDSFEKSMAGFKGSSQHLGWSANLRVRTVKALGFLEGVGMVRVDNRKGRLAITDLGSKVISRTMSEDSDLSYNLAQIQRAYRNICVEKQLKLELI